MTVYKPIELNELDESIAQQVATTLNVTEETPVEAIRRMFAFLGAEQVHDILKKAQTIEADGGLYYGGKNNRKRRTVGGTFFHTARSIVPRALWKEKIHFPSRKLQKTGEEEINHPPYEWEARIEDVKELDSENKGEASVEIKLIGTPANVIDKGAIMILVMTGKLPTAMPKGLPELPETYKPVYLAMIAKKQWKKVADKIEAGERLVLTGFPIYDEKLKRITVLVKSAQTIPPKKPKAKKTDS